MSGIAGLSSSQPLRADVNVSSSSVLPKDASPPQLPGQTQATADMWGNMRLDGIILLAAPGLYSLSVALPAFPQVKNHNDANHLACTVCQSHSPPFLKDHNIAELGPSRERLQQLITYPCLLL